MAACPSPIAAENFQSAWKVITRKRRWSIKKQMIRWLATFSGQLTFFFLFLFLAMGIIYEMGGPLVRDYMDQIPMVGHWWSRFAAPFFADMSGEIVRILYCIGALYLLPLATTIPLAMVISLLYHPRTPKQTGNMKQDAGQLHQLAKHAQACAWDKSSYIRKICVFSMGAIMIWFAVGLLYFTYGHPPLQESVAPIALRTNLGSIMYCAGAFLLYRVMNIPLRKLIRGLYFCNVPASMVTDTADYYTEVSQQETAVTENKGDA